MNSKDPKVQQKLIDSINETNRKDTWLQITGAGFLMSNNPVYFSELCLLAKTQENKTMKQIDKDISRTFPKDKTLDKFSLRRVLEAYSVRNQNVGYCQGINFIVATLIRLGFNDEEAFWMFVQIVEHYIPTSYYTSMSGVILDQKVFDHLLRIKQSKLMRLMEKMGLSSNLFTIQWFICLFSFSFDLQIVTFFWDNIFVRGFLIVFPICLAVVSKIKKLISSQKDFIEALAVIDQACMSLNDRVEMKKALEKKSAKVPLGFIVRLRLVYEPEVLNEFCLRFATVIPAESLIRSLGAKCSDDNECKQKILATCQYFTFATRSLEEVEDYIDNRSYPAFHSALQQTPELMLGKKNHKCNFDDLQFAEIEPPIENLRKTIMMVNSNKSYEYVSTFVNIEDYED